MTRTAAPRAACRPAEQAPLDGEASTDASRDLAAEWRAGRMAAADDLVDRLPEFLYLSQIPGVLGVPMARVLQAVRSGAIATEGRGARRRMICARSREFLAFEGSIRLSLPVRLGLGLGVGVGAERELLELKVTVALPRDVYQRLIEIGSRRGVPVERLISEAAVAAYAR